MSVIISRYAPACVPATDCRAQRTGCKSPICLCLSVYIAVPATLLKEKLALLQPLDITLRTVATVST